MMILCRDTVYSDCETVYSIDSKQLCLIKKVDKYSGWASLVTLELLDKEGKLTGTFIQYPGDYFMKGSGHGGGPYIVPYFNCKFKNGKISYEDIL